MNEYFPTVVQVIPLDNYHVQVFFDDGKIVDYDTTQDLKSSIFEPLGDIENFNFLRQTRYLQNMSYLRCKNITLGYTVPEKWMKVIV